MDEYLILYNLIYVCIIVKKERRASIIDTRKEQIAEDTHSKVCYTMTELPLFEYCKFEMFASVPFLLNISE